MDSQTQAATADKSPRHETAATGSYSFTISDSQQAVQWRRAVGVVTDVLLAQVDGLTVTALVEDEAFVDAARRTAIIAAHGDSHEMRTALQNALRNIGVGNVTDAPERATHLGHISALTGAHLALLALMTKTELLWSSDEKGLHRLVDTSERRGLIESGHAVEEVDYDLCFARLTAAGHALLLFTTGPFSIPVG